MINLKVIHMLKKISLFSLLVFISVSCAPQHGPASDEFVKNRQLKSPVTHDKIVSDSRRLSGGYPSKVNKSTPMPSEFLDSGDVSYYERIMQPALEQNEDGTTSRWINPNTGNSGTITPTRYYQRADGTYCREFTETISVVGSKKELYRTACRVGSGVWQITKN